jgi:type 1 fimbriae regulatory protein FimB/type 1 fimbriae regulatory protein FimE
MKPMLRLISPTLENCAVGTRTPRRPPNAEMRPRGEYLTASEVDRLVDAAKRNRHGHRDATMILLCYRHGFRAAEICDLRWNQITFDEARIHVKRVKRGTPSVHPLQGDTAHMLRHSCGYKLANDGVDTRSLSQYLGHRSLQHTARYTELAANRFDSFWR